MAKTILTGRQKQLLILLSGQTVITKNFYLSGGTALAEYYLHHRYSEDLDFFSMDEVDPMAIQVILKKIQKNTKMQSVDFQQSFNRNLFFLHSNGEVIKTEFTYYPFVQLEKPRIIDNLRIDSLLDIAVNKVFTIYQRPKSRDFIDLYLIMRQEKWPFLFLQEKARQKFDTHIDPLRMVSQLLKIKELRDYPRMIIGIDLKKLEKFWLSQAANLKTKVLK
ncbi:MAG: hypothetical protein HW400_601 [Candidatus Levybacteria bacterium]|nr:hypothetical protein [Candidatus Levybacteria bacterium]